MLRTYNEFNFIQSCLINSKTKENSISLASGKGEENTEEESICRKDQKLEICSQFSRKR